MIIGPTYIIQILPLYFNHQYSTWHYYQDRTQVNGKAFLLKQVYLSPLLDFIHQYLQARSLLMLDFSMLKELVIKTLGKMLAILKPIKEPLASPLSLANYTKIMTTKLPQLHSEMTAQLQKFKKTGTYSQKLIIFPSRSWTLNYTVVLLKLSRTPLSTSILWFLTSWYTTWILVIITLT